MPKSKDAFRTISEVAEWLDTQPHVLRFWESKFTQVRPVKRAGGRRYYRPADMMLLGGIKTLLHDDGMTIKGVQKLLREKGVKDISALSRPLDDELQDTVESAAKEASPAPAVVKEAAEDVAEAVKAPAQDDETVVALKDTTETADPVAPEEAVADLMADAPAALAVEEAEAPALESAPETAPAEKTAAPLTPKKPLANENSEWRLRRKVIARLIEIDHIPAANQAAVAKAVAALAAVQSKSNAASAG